MTGDVVSIGCQAAADESAPAADRLLTGNPRQKIWNGFSSSDERFHVGQWHSTPGSWRVKYTENEFCHLLEGRIRLTSDNGDISEYSAGDSFVIASGFSGIWAVLAECRKLYAIYEPATVTS